MGGLAELFASPSMIFPSGILNSGVFLKWFGFPIQLLRAGSAAFVAVFIIHSLRVFEVENRRQIAELHEAQLAERRRLEATRAELLHRTVQALEAERQRIARELHDETGQTLTALGMGLRGLATTINLNPTRAIQQANQLEGLAVSGIDELQRLVSGLHPPQLDDLGLLAALRWYTSEVQKRIGIEIRLSSHGNQSSAAFRDKDRPLPNRTGRNYKYDPTCFCIAIGNRAGLFSRFHPYENPR